MADTIATVALTLGQRIAACKLIANDINGGNSGLSAEQWTTKTPKEGCGISVYQDGKKFAQLTVNPKGYLTLRNYLASIEPATLAKLERFGFSPGRFTETVPNYNEPAKFDSSRLAK